MKNRYKSRRLREISLSPVMSLFCLCMTLIIVASLPAAASQHQSEVVKPSAASVYPAEFFAQYQPQNALEMVKHLPGFVFDEGSSSRGFGGNAGNVLIDGQRRISNYTADWMSFALL